MAATDYAAINKEAIKDSLSSLRVWGFSLNRAWVYLMFLGIGAGILSLDGVPLTSTVYIFSTVSLCLVLLFGVAFHQTFEPWLATATARRLAVVLTSVGTLCATILPALHVPDMLVGVLGGISTGVGSGLLDLCYGQLYREVPPLQTRLETPFSALLAAVIFVLISMIDMPAVELVLTSLLPLCSGGVLLLQVRKTGVAQEFHTLSALAPSKRLIARIGVCAGGVGIADGVNRGLFLSVTDLSLAEFYGVAMLPSAVLAAAVIIGFALLTSKSRGSSLYKIVCFMMIASLVLTPVLAAAGEFEVGSIVLLTGYNTFNVFIWVLLSDLSYNLRISAAATFGVGWGMLTAGHAVGQVLSSLMPQAIVAGSAAHMAVSSFCILLTLAACLFVLRDDDFVSEGDVETLVVRMSQSLDSLEAGVAAADEGVTAEVATAAPMQEAPATTEAASTSEMPVAEEEAPAGSYADRCAAFARQCGLTPRETEILLLFARGRTAARIQEELYLSRGTVTTHLQHIYQKAGVHSRQELLDRLEEMR